MGQRPTVFQLILAFGNAEASTFAKSALETLSPRGWGLSMAAGAAALLAALWRSLVSRSSASAVSSSIVIRIFYSVECGQRVLRGLGCFNLSLLRLKRTFSGIDSLRQIVEGSLSLPVCLV